MKKLTIKWTIALAILTMLAACEDGGRDEKVEKPQLPPQSSFLMDFDFFDQNFDEKSKSLALKSEEVQSATYQNILRSSGVILVWHGLIYKTFAVPVAAFNHSFNYDAEFIGDATWQWSYSVDLDQVTYGAVLQGKVLSDSVHWKMYVSKNGAYEDYLWFEGKSAINRSGGYWVLYHRPQGQMANEEAILINWEWNPASEEGKIKYTNVIESDNNYMSFIEYGNDMEEDYPAYFNLFVSSTGDSLTIHYNKETHLGRIKDSGFYNDQLWHCWNEMFQDISCYVE